MKNIFVVVKIQKDFEEFKVLQNKIANLANDSRDRYTRIFNITYPPKHTGRLQKDF